MWTFRNQPAAPHLIEKLYELTEKLLPRSYLEFLASSDGGEAEIAIQPCVVQLFSVETVLALLSQTEDDFDMPGLIRIGSNGASESILFDMRYPGPYVSALNCSSDYSDLMLIAETFDELLALCDAPVQNDEELEEALRNSEAESLASKLVGFNLWSSKGRIDNCEHLEIDKYAKEFVAFGDSGNDFLGIDRRDGTIWSANVLGTRHLRATKLADSIDEIEQLLEVRRKMWPNLRKSLNRYYEPPNVILDDDTEFDSFKSMWFGEIKPWLQRTFVVEKPYCVLCIYFVAEHAVVPTLVNAMNGCSVAIEPMQTFNYRDIESLLSVVQAALEAGIPEPQGFEETQLICDGLGKSAFGSLDLLQRYFGANNWFELEQKSIRLSFRYYPSGWLINCTGRSADRNWSQKDWLELRLSAEQANVQDVVDQVFQHLSGRRDLAGFMSRANQYNSQ